MEFKVFISQLKAGVFLWLSFYKRSTMLIAVLLIRPYLVLAALLAINPNVSPTSIVKDVLISLLVVSSIDVLWDAASNALSFRFLGILPYVFISSSSPSLPIVLSYLPKYLFESFLKSIEFLPVFLLLNSASGVYILLIMFIISLLGVLPLLGLSSVITYAVLASREETVWMDWLAPLLLLISGAFYPVSILPPWLQTISSLVPTTYLFEIVRIVSEGGATAETLIAISLIYMTSSMLFNTVFQFIVSRSESELLRKGIHI